MGFFLSVNYLLWVYYLSVNYSFLDLLLDFFFPAIVLFEVGNDP